MQNIVVKIKVKLVLISKFEAEKTLGINKKIEKGFKTPPDRKSRKLN